jgi:hypothetical protein
VNADVHHRRDAGHAHRDVDRDHHDAGPHRRGAGHVRHDGAHGRHDAGRVHDAGLVLIPRVVDPFHHDDDRVRLNAVRLKNAATSAVRHRTSAAHIIFNSRKCSNASLAKTTLFSTI